MSAAEYKWVPLEPTEEMFVAGMEADCVGRPSLDDDTHVRGIWNAMLAAVPKARWSCPECHIPEGCIVGSCAIGSKPPAARARDVGAHAALSVDCPHCWAKAGNSCMWPETKETNRDQPHKARLATFAAPAAADGTAQEINRLTLALLAAGRSLQTIAENKEADEWLVGDLQAVRRYAGERARPAIGAAKIAPALAPPPAPQAPAVAEVGREELLDELLNTHGFKGDVEEIMDTILAATRPADREAP